MRLVFDLESNGLLDQITKIHCIVTKDIDTGELKKFRPFEVEQALHLLMQADQVIGHNIIGFDIPAIKKLYPWFDIDWSKVKDTLVLSRLVFPDIADKDANVAALVAAKMVGKHSLEAWGLRLKFHKLNYQGSWEAFSEDMLEYNVIDVEITDKLLSHLVKQGISPTADELEHQVAIIIAEQERYGFLFDVPKAEALTSKLMQRRAELEQELQEAFKPFIVADGEVTIPKRSIKYKNKPEVTAGHPYQKIKITVFNPGSRQHIINRLQFLYDWKPVELTDKGQAKVDENVLSTLPWPEAKLLTEYFLVQKRLGMLAEGDNAWLKLVKDGRIHGQLNTNGAVTGRATHFNPNIAQVPTVGAIYGADCRELFTVPPNKTQVGVDISGLELRMLAHFMAKWDGGSYGKIVCGGDPHTVNQQAAELETRAQAKTFIYAFLYGAGSWKIGHIAQPAAPNEQIKVNLGKRLKSKFIMRTPGLKQLVDGVKKAAGRGYLVGLDGRRLHIRSDHAALNTLLQSAGALVCKRWLVEVDRELIKRGWKDRVKQIAWVHDECQYEVDTGLAEEFGKLSVDCIRRAGEFFNIRVPLTGEFKIGNNWKECH